MENKKLINILMVDDHYMILEGYKNVLSGLELENVFTNFHTIDNCDDAWEMVSTSNFDIVFLDINFTPKNDAKILSGEDLGIKIKKAFPSIKIVVLTTLENSFRLQNIFNNVEPDGFLLKGETTSKNLIRCLESVIDNPPYYGPKISKLLRSEMKLKYTLDEVDRIILFQLSIGTKTKDITDHVHLSLRAVENRKKKLKEIFDVFESGNKELLERARECGYI